MVQMDCEVALAVLHGESPQHVVNKDVLEHPAFLRKLASYRSAFAGKHL